MWVCDGCLFLVVSSRQHLEATNGPGIPCGCKRGTFCAVPEGVAAQLRTLHQEWALAEEAARLLGQPYYGSSPIHTIFRDRKAIKELMKRARARPKHEGPNRQRHGRG